jgi:ribosome-binding protein aMBF1 (putative translation factor)
MSRDRYLAKQRSDPAYEAARAVARANLDLAAALHRQREALGLSQEDAAAKAGLTVHRLEMIEEGDTSSLTELLRLLSAFGLVLRIERDLRVVVSPADPTDAGVPGGDRAVVATGSLSGGR